MPTSESPPLVATTDGEAAFLAQALDYYRAVKRAGKDAPFGQFLNHADAAVKKDGQELLRQSLANILQAEIDEIDKKKETRICPGCQQNTRHLGYREKTSKVPAAPYVPNGFTTNVVLAAFWNILPMRR
jgi:hypothetical protein